MSRLAPFVIFVVLAGTAFAQNRAPQPAPADPVALLTAEVRALRAEIAEAARSSIRLQLLVARLQLQEQRIIYLDRQRSDATTRLAAVQQQRAQIESGMKIFGDNPPKNGPFQALKQQVALLETQEQELRTQETDLLNSLAAEQARWSDLSGRLEELERSLAEKTR